jgi:tetratricopeptide (TPR) repeat protein
MNPNPTINKALKALAALTLVALPLTGCNNSHKEWKESADNRWHDLRSAAMLDMAQDQFSSGQLDQAEKTVREAAAIDADHPGLHLLAGRIALERSQLERAYRMFEVSAGLEERNPDAYYYQGVVLQRWQNHKAALLCYEKAYEYDAENASRLLAVAETMVALDRSDEAIELLESKKLYFDQNAGCRAMLGHLYAMKADYDKAIENFRQATMLDPDNVRMLEELAYNLIAAEQFVKASTIIEDLLNRPEYQTRWDLMRQLAASEEQIGRIDRARQVYIDLTRANPENTNDWVRLGELCWKLEDTGGTLIAANRAINLEPHRHEGYILAGLVWQKRGRLDDALKMFDRAAELAPQSSTPLLLRGLSLQKADRNAAAAEAYSQALERNPKDPRAKRLLSSVSVEP